MSLTSDSYRSVFQDIHKLDKQNISRCYFAMVAIFGVILINSTSAYSQTVTSSDRTQSESKISTKQKTSESLTRNILDTKPFQYPLTISIKELNGDATLARIAKASHRQISAEDNEFSLQTFFVACKEVPVQAFMDAIAMADRDRWKKLSGSEYAITASMDTELVGIVPSSPYEVDRTEAAIHFLNLLHDLSPDDADKLLSGTPFPAQSLPSQLSDCLFGMIQKEDQHIHETDPNDVPATRSDFDSSTILIRPTKKEHATELQFTMLSSGISYSWAIVVPEIDKSLTSPETATQRQLYDAIVAGIRKQEKEYYTPVRTELDKTKDLPTALKQIVTIDKDNATLPEILALLYTDYNVPFVADSKNAFPQKANVHLSAQPLYKVMDQLSSLYPETYWEYRPYGFFVILSKTKHLWLPSWQNTTSILIPDK